MPLDAVLKIGGSLSRGSGLPGLCREIGLLGAKYALLVVPGGGAFADLVRESYRKYDLDETVAHRMALLAMDQYGYLLHQLIPGSSLQADPAAASRTAESGRVAVLLPSSPVIHSDPLPNSWQVTSDTIAAWFANEAQCRRLVLLKDVDGLWAAGCPEEMIRDMTAEELSGHEGGVDGFLARYLASTRLVTWIVNGLKPGRIVELLTSGTTTGTRIRPD